MAAECSDDVAAECSDDVAAERSDVGNYDVFINFRGADTREGFAYRLYNCLKAEGIRVFVDDEELNKGRRLDVELLQAINNSKIYITIISKRYTSSKWCLRELAEIVRNKQKFKEKKEILPVFYKIKAEDVKLRTDLFKDQLNCLKEKVPAETVEAWAEALRGIPNLKAWTVPSHGGFEEEGQYCRDIVKRVSIILRAKHKPLPKVLTGMEDPVEKVMQLLDIKSPGFQVIGIHGIGGIGKTTLAKAVYNKLCDDKFDCCCFLPDVRESLDNDKGSKNCLELQKKLLQQVSYGGDIDEIRDVVDAVRRIQLTLEGKKVLIVFDDVSDVDQILQLISNNGSIDMLNGSRNRIIITTRDDRVLRKNREFLGFTKIHTMQKMKDEHALELFSWHAFGEPMPPTDYVERSKDVVNLTGRLPLSLKIIGSAFCLGGRENWKQRVEKLKDMLHKDVYERLKISYEDLERHTREVFLDIACFFVDKKVSHEIHMWRACEFHPELAIEELISMCFVKIDKFGIYRMHDNIKDLGREIVRREGPEYKEQRSRIWKKQDSIDILTSMKKENNIKGIILGHQEDNKILTLKAEHCVHLNKLRFLNLNHEISVWKPNFCIAYSFQLEGSFKDLLPNLRWLSLKKIRMERFKVTNFNLEKLVVLDLSSSDITESWPGWKEFKDLPSLEVLNLSDCKNLKKTPDLSHCTSLKVLILSNCGGLEEIDHSIIYLKALEYLDLSHCQSLKELTPDLSQCTSLKKLMLSHCRSLEEIDRSIIYPNALEYLDLSKCRSLKKFTPDLSQCTSLKKLVLSHCRSLEEIDGSIIYLKALEYLDLSNCTLLKELSADEPLEDSTRPSSIGVGLVNLEHLSLKSCHSLKSRRILITSPPKLRHLDLSDCWRLKKLPDSIGELVELEVLVLVNCMRLVSLPNSLRNLPKLLILDLKGCNSLKRLPRSVGKMVLQLKELHIVNTTWKKLARFISKQKRLEVLCAKFTEEKLGKIPKEIEDLHCLREISFHGSGICGLPSLVKLTRLEKLSLDHCNHLQQLPAELPSSLVQLHVWSDSLYSIPDYSNLIHLTDMSLHLFNPRRNMLEQRVLRLSWIWKLPKLKNLSIKTYFATTIQSEEPFTCLSQLEKLTLGCSVLGKCFVMPSFPALRELKIVLYGGAVLLSLPRLNHLTSFVLLYSYNLIQILGLEGLDSLISLDIRECNSLKRLDDISKLRQLQTLRIYGCEKLRVISVLPCLRSLMKLEIIECDSLESLVGPSKKSESYLDDLLLVQSLKIENCPLLPEDLQRRIEDRVLKEEEGMSRYF